MVVGSGWTGFVVESGTRKLKNLYRMDCVPGTICNTIKALAVIFNAFCLGHT